MKSISSRQLNQIIEFSKKHCSSSDFDHKYDHIKDTVRLAKYLAKIEKADIEVSIVSAYLHDVVANKMRKKHGVLGAKLSRTFLNKIGAPEHFVKQVCYAISQHNNGSVKRTKEAKILWDADKLQLIGPLGFARVLRYHFLALDYVDIFETLKKAVKYENFFNKRFYTKTGKTIANKLHKFMDKFHILCKKVKTAKFNRLNI